MPLEFAGPNIAQRIVSRFVTKSNLIPTLIMPSIERLPLSPKDVQKEFIERSKNAKLKIAGIAKKDPSRLNAKRLQPRHKLELFDSTFYFTDVFQIPELRFFVVYVIQSSDGKREMVYPRIFYKDLSLAWRSASHFAGVEGDIWVGKGDVRDAIQDGYEMVVSDESTTDLPLEMQTGVDNLLAWSKKPFNGKGVLEMILRRGPDDRVEPYADFIRPRELAASNRNNLINRARPILNFTRKNDPRSLKVIKGYEPDFKHGIVEQSESKSKLYGGTLRRYRILSTNKLVQYYFFAGTKHVWIIPPQAMTTELSSYGVRTIDVEADDDLFIPGYEYHYVEEDDDGEDKLYSQIPEGFAGTACPVDDAKADASPWLNEIPMIQEFRRKILKS